MHRKRSPAQKAAFTRFRGLGFLISSANGLMNLRLEAELNGAERQELADIAQELYKLAKSWKENSPKIIQNFSGKVV